MYPSVLTLFASTGWSLEDLVAAELVISHAHRLGLGTVVALQHEPGDPYDPYWPLRRAPASVSRPIDEAEAS